eukprot:5031831-Pyramimonas_sp.AAC.1
MVPFAPAVPPLPAAGMGNPFQQNHAQQMQMQQYMAQFAMMMQQQFGLGAPAGGVNLTFAPGFGGAPPSRADVGASTRAPGGGGRQQPVSDAGASGGDEDMPTVQGDPLAELNAAMKANESARKDMLSDKRKKISKSATIRKAAKASRSEGGAGDDDLSSDGGDDAVVRRRPAGRMPRPAAAAPRKAK